MTLRSRLLAYGSAAVSVAAGAACVAAFDGLFAEVVAIALIAAGLGAVVLLVFFEVGLSEDRERARDSQSQDRQSKLRHESSGRPSPGRRPRRPG